MSAFSDSLPHTAMAASRLASVDYEVFGRVQGVFFRKFTQKTAIQLGLVGWVKNTDRGTVVGIVQGPEAKVMTMKDWLAKTGSPKSNITRCDFKNEKTVTEMSFQEFVIDKPKTKKKTTRKK